MIMSSIPDVPPCSAPRSWTWLYKQPRSLSESSDGHSLLRGVVWNFGMEKRGNTWRASLGSGVELV